VATGAARAPPRSPLATPNTSWKAIRFMQEFPGIVHVVCVQGEQATCLYMNTPREAKGAVLSGGAGPNSPTTGTPRRAAR
jgi:hypothetical protein